MSDTQLLEEREDVPSSSPFPVVGIGASAGGIPALQALLAGLPATTGMAFVVVMHLPADHDSALGPILQRACMLPVLTVSESSAILADRVYLVSPSRAFGFADGGLQVAAGDIPPGSQRSIDAFFRSLAHAHGDRAVCVVLSGTGNDGAQGLKRVKELGGVAIAQSPEEAEFDGMPCAAIQTGAVDFVLRAPEMPGKLRLLWENAQRIALPTPAVERRLLPHTSSDDGQLDEEALLSIKALLRERTGHDFAHYKRATVLRRLERRMRVNGLPDLPSYRRFLDAEPDETGALLQDMLISVTNFFRDPEAFDALGQALRRSASQRPADEPIRAWVAGCATGEEAYSTAILLREALGPLKTALQIFASDIDARAVAQARAGLYPSSIATDVSPARLRDHFVEGVGGFRIAKSVRDSVVFSVHNVLSDPPFTRMDLICCRNLLIYLDRSAQAQLLRSFHFASKPRGLLFLGSSETADAADGHFAAEDKRHRVYRASEVAKRSPAVSTPGSLAALGVPIEPPPLPRRSGAGRAPLPTLHARVMARLAPATVLVDADDNALHVDERASHLLRLPAGAPTHKLLALARPELRAELRSALARSAASGRSVEARRVRLLVNGEPRHIAMSVRPAHEDLSPGLFLVIFDETQETMAPDAEEPASRDPVVESLEAQLIRVEDELRDTRGEASASTEELRASNEELQTINEELRSTSEELETSREELQAVNEELSTVNGELQAKIDETSKANDDLHNLMVSAEIGAVFIDREMRVKRFTPQAATLFNLLRSDVGRSLLDITHRLDYPELEADAGDVMRDLRRVEREVRAGDGRWFVARALPYRTSEDHIDGMIFAFIDVSSRKAAEEMLRLSEQRMRLVAMSMRDYAILTTNEAGIISTWSPGAERVFGYAPDEAIGEPFALIFTAEDRAAGAPVEELRKARENGRAPDDRWHVRKGGQTIYCSGITTPLIEGGLVGYAKIARDYTMAELRERQRDAALREERIEREKLQEASLLKDEFLAVMSHELKNPLAVIQMSAILLTRSPAFAAEPRAARATDAIQSAVVSQAQIINDLLELSRVNMGKVVLRLAPVDLSDLVRGIAQAVMPDVDAKQQRLELDLAESVTVVADSVRVEQIVWNLLTNAVKFTPEGGRIQLGLAVVGEMAELSVADSGIGMDPSVLEDVFEMFRQVETGPSRKKTGLGIGLALVKQLTALHDGRVKATSDGPGRGAEFRIWLPLAAPADGPAELAVPETEPARLRGLKVLLVDDEPVLLSSFADLLEAEGASVVPVNAPERAVELARDGGFDLVISDIAMPERDGYWLARQLRAGPNGAALTIVAVSGMAREADRQKAFSAGFDAHVGKPLDFDRLQAEIESAVTRRRRASAG